MGHLRPFEFEDRYAPAHGIRRFLCGTPSILGLLSLEVGVDLMLRCRMQDVVQKSRWLSELFVDLLTPRQLDVIGEVAETVLAALADGR